MKNFGYLEEWRGREAAGHLKELEVPSILPLKTKLTAIDEYLKRT